MAQKITEDQLKAITDQEIRQSLGYMGGKLSEQRRKAEYYYLGLPKGDLSPPEVEGRSTVVSTDVADTVEWMLPALLKIFTAGDNVVEFAPQQQNDEQAAKQATDYVNYVFYRQNAGFKTLYTWFKDALLQKTGILKVWWEDKTDEAREEYQGLTDVELAMLLQDPEVVPIEHSARPAQAADTQADPMDSAQMAGGQDVGDAGGMPQQMPPMMLHDVTVKRVKKRGQVRIENVPPEEFLISRRAKTIADAPFVAHRLMRTVSDLKAMGYQNVDALTSDDNAQAMNPERVERIGIDDETPYLTGNDNTIDQSQRVLWITECYLKVDFDGDGIAEWRKIVRCGNQLLDNEECDGPPFVAITPIPLPHRFHGLSIADMAIPIQQQKTSVLRAILDNLYLQVNGRYFAVDGQVNLDDLLTSRPGGVVRVKQPGMAGRLDQGMADAGAAYQMLEYMEVQKENRTGFTRYSQGNSADSLNKTATGINIVTNRSDARVELIARVFSETGVKDLFKLILKLVSQHQDRAAMMQINGQWLQIDPREWKNQFDLTINVGLGTGNKDQVVQHLMALMNVQKEALQIGLATPRNLFNSASKLAENLGFKQSDMFFTDPDHAQQQQKPQPPDPKLIEVQAKAQAEQERLKMEWAKLAGEQQLARERLEAEITLKREQFALQLSADKEAALYQAIYKQSEATVDGTQSGIGAGAAGNGVAGAPAFQGGGGFAPSTVDVGMGNQPGA